MPESKDLKIFISYAHADEPFFKVFRRRFNISVISRSRFNWLPWDDKNIHVGTFWDTEIQLQVGACNIALLLVSLSFMGSEYIKEQEYKAFLKRQQDNQILIIPVMFAPCDFKNWKDLSKPQFFSPPGSDYGHNDLDDFTFADLVKFNQRDGNFIPNTDVDRYILNLLNKIEDSFEEFQKRKESHAIDTSSNHLNHLDDVDSLWDYPSPDSLFTGRQDEIKEFENLFQTNRLIVIEGLGGSGKSQFVAKCLQNVAQKNVLWMDGSSESKFDIFIEAAGYGNILKAFKKTQLAIFDKLKDSIENDNKIIVWDNFNEYNDPLFSGFISASFRYLRKSTIIVIAKTNPHFEGITTFATIKLEGLNNDAFTFSQKLRNSNSKYSHITNENLRKICHGVDGHPLAIEFAISLMGYGATENEILNNLSDYNWVKVEEFSRRLFLDIFNHNSTTQEEKECLLNASVFFGKVSKDELQYLNGSKNVLPVLAGLVDKLLINYKNNFYEIHPLVRTFCYEKIDYKEIVHRKVATFFTMKRTGVLNIILEEKIYFHKSKAEEFLSIADDVKKFGRNIIKIGQIKFLSKIIGNLRSKNIDEPIFDIFEGDIAQMQGDLNKAIIFFNKAMSTISDDEIMAESTIKYGEMLFRKGDLIDALPYFEKGYDFTKQQSLTRLGSRALNDIGLVNLNFNNLRLAHEQLTLALKIQLASGDREGAGNTYNNLALFYYKELRFGKAIVFNNKAIQIAEADNDKANLAVYLPNIADCYRLSGELDKSYSYNLRGLELIEETGNDYNKGFCLNNLGLTLLAQKKSKEGYELLLQAFEQRRQIGDKLAIASSLLNIGDYHLERKQFDLALENFIKSYILNYSAQNISVLSIVKQAIIKVKSDMEVDKFLNLFKDKVSELNEFQKTIIEEIGIGNKEELNMKGTKVGRNNRCPCGSGKKYKYCHGKPQ